MKVTKTPSFLSSSATTVQSPSINGRKHEAHTYIKLRWHIIQMFKWFCHGKMEVPLPGAGKAEAYANKMIDVLNSDNKSYIKIFEKCQALIDEVGFPSDDSLKRGKFTQEIMTAVEAKLQHKGN